MLEVCNKTENTQEEKEYQIEMLNNLQSFKTEKSNHSIKMIKKARF